MLWQKAKAIGVAPSQLIGLKSGTYEAYCLDEAVIYFGLMVENQLDEAGHKPSKEERKARAAREKVLDGIMGTNKNKTGFADPALMFK